MYIYTRIYTLAVLQITPQLKLMGVHFKCSTKCHSQRDVKEEEEVSYAYKLQEQLRIEIVETLRKALASKIPLEVLESNKSSSVRGRHYLAWIIWKTTIHGLSTTWLGLHFVGFYDFIFFGTRFQPFKIAHPLKKFQVRQCIYVHIYTYILIYYIYTESFH